MQIYLGGDVYSSWRNAAKKELLGHCYSASTSSWAESEKAKQQSDYLLYVIVPQYSDIYGIAELVESLFTAQERTVVCFPDEYDGVIWSAEQKPSIDSVKRLMAKHSWPYFESLSAALIHLNIKISFRLANRAGLSNSDEYGLSFKNALIVSASGYKIRRRAWENKYTYLRIESKNSKFDTYQIAPDQRISQGINLSFDDIAANDWEILR